MHALINTLSPTNRNKLRFQQKNSSLFKYRDFFSKDEVLSLELRYYLRTRRLYT